MQWRHVKDLLAILFIGMILGGVFVLAVTNILEGK